MRHRRAIPLTTGALVSLLLLAGCGQTPGEPGATGDEPTETAGASGEDAVILRVGTVFPADHAINRALEGVNDRVQDRTDGLVSIELFTDSQLGNNEEVLEQYMSGDTVAGHVNGTMVSQFGVPEMAATSAMYLFDGPEQVASFAKSDLYEGWRDELADNGLILMAFNWYLGERHVISTNPDGYPGPQDIAGSALRIPAGDTWSIYFNSLGVDASTLAPTETYTAMQQGLVSGAEGPLSQMIAWSLDELGKSVTLTGHANEVTGFATGAALWSQLTAGQQSILVEEFERGGVEFSTATVEEVSTLRDQLEANGLRFIEADHDAYRQVADDAYSTSDVPWPDGTIETIREAAR